MSVVIPFAFKSLGLKPLEIDPRSFKTETSKGGKSLMLLNVLNIVVIKGHTTLSIVDNTGAAALNKQKNMLSKVIIYKSLIYFINTYNITFVGNEFHSVIDIPHARFFMALITFGETKLLPFSLIIVTNTVS